MVVLLVEYLALLKDVNSVAWKAFWKVVNLEISLAVYSVENTVVSTAAW